MICFLTVEEILSETQKTPVSEIQRTMTIRMDKQGA
jgi:hypothetical protein